MGKDFSKDRLLQNIAYLFEVNREVKLEKGEILG